MKCECGKEFEGNFCPSCGKPAQQQTITQNINQQQTNMQQERENIQSQNVQQTAELQVQYNQQNYNNMNGQGIPNQNYYNGMNGQGIPNQNYYNSMNGQENSNQNYYNGMNGQGIPNQNYYNGMNGQNMPNPLTGKQRLCYWGVMILIIILAILFFAGDEVLCGFCFLIAAVLLCPGILDKLSKRTQKTVGFITIGLLIGSVFLAALLGDEDEEIKKYGGSSDSGVETVQEGYIGDTVSCGGWEITVTNVEEESFGDDIKLSCDVSITNVSGEELMFYPDDILELNNNGIIDQVGISCDYIGKTIASGVSFNDCFRFYLPESANIDVHKMTLDVGGLPIHLYNYN